MPPKEKEEILQAQDTNIVGLDALQGAALFHPLITQDV
jgi:hypothetical protein